MKPQQTLTTAEQLKLSLLHIIWTRISDNQKRIDYHVNSYQKKLRNAELTAHSKWKQPKKIKDYIEKFNNEFHWDTEYMTAQTNRLKEVFDIILDDQPLNGSLYNLLQESGIIGSGSYQVYLDVNLDADDLKPMLREINLRKLLN